MRTATALRLLPSETDLGAFIDHPSGYLALNPKNQRFMASGGNGFIAYREQGRHLFLLGGVHALESSRGPLLDEFLNEAESRKRRVVAVQIRRDQTALFRSRGFIVNQLGSSYGIKLDGYSLGGKKCMKLRNKIKRARGQGIQILEVGRELPRDARTFAGLSDISERWIRNKGKKELDFMIGELGSIEDDARRIFIAVQRKDLGSQDSASWLGFITYVPAYGKHPGYLHDLTRRIPDAPPGTMELCNAEAMERLRSEGTRYLHFGFTPFITCGDEEPQSSRVMAWVIRALARYGRLIYPAQSQVDYKLKWTPNLIEPEYVAARPLSARAVFDLLILTRSI